MVRIVRPQPGEIVQDPAAGTAGFLIAADRYVKSMTGNLTSLTPAHQRFQVNEAMQGVELVMETRRLALMNLMLHEIKGDLKLGDALAQVGKDLPPADVILSNPPFGTKNGGGFPSRDDLPHQTSNKQFNFLQHIYRALKPGGRAAVVLPDNVLFENGVGTVVRRELMDMCNLHTILRLPTGIFYAQGVKTNVLFFSRGEKNKGSTKDVWVYDLRANMPQFGKRTALTREHFAEFEASFGSDPLGSPKILAKRRDTGEGGRFRRFKREWIAERGESLDISWLKDESDGANDEQPEPATLAREAMAELEGAFEELRGILAELGEDVIEAGT